ncbi:MAG: TetR family transcriptional regulator [Myxococcales bacterium]|nr:TetR family transcriptional regulator [Myxococcales bacterium]
MKKKKKAPSAAEPPANPAAVRRIPTQERSKQRLERILDAADGVFAELGFDKATMEQIADRAETSIGSVYQFFPNKTALFESLCARYLERAQQLFEGMLVDISPDEAWTELVDKAIDTFWKFHVDLPGFRSVWVHQNISPELLAASDVVNQAIADRSEAVLATFAPDVPRARRRAATGVVVETISAILFVAVRRDHDEAERLVAELKTMVRAYFQSVLGELPAKARRKEAAHKLPERLGDERAADVKLGVARSKPRKKRGA